MRVIIGKIMALFLCVYKENRPCFNKLLKTADKRDKDRPVYKVGQNVKSISL